MFENSSDPKIFAQKQRVLPVASLLKDVGFRCACHNWSTHGGRLVFLILCRDCFSFALAGTVLWVLLAAWRPKLIPVPVSPWSSRQERDTGGIYVS